LVQLQHLLRCSEVMRIGLAEFEDHLCSILRPNQMSASILTRSKADSGSGAMRSKAQ
jgi:hypothetical protein